MDTPRPPSPLELAQRQRSIILRFVRMAFFALITTVAILLTIQSQQEGGAKYTLEWWQPVSLAVFLFCFAILIDLFTPAKKLTTISALFFGLLGGMLATAALGAVIDLLIAAWVAKPEAIAGVVAIFKVMLGMALCYLGVSAVLQTQDDFRLVIPYVEFAKQTRGVRPNLLDTSALIDARVADIAATGLIQSPFIVPGFVIAELQLLADSGEKLKRARGRRGLEIVTRLQRMPNIDLSIDDTSTQSRAVDQALIELAERLGARIVTTDLGLQRVAEIRKITVINIHDLAAALKPALVPGEHIMARLVKPGEQPGQGVGYLDDGTMIVAEGGIALVGGPETQLLVTSTMQTAAGRLIFAKATASLAPEPPTPASPSGDAEPDAHAAHRVDPAHLPESSPRSSSAGGPAEHSDDASPNAPQPDSSRPAAVTTPAAEPRRPGPFPPKPPTQRTGTPRNPRR